MNIYIGIDVAKTFHIARVINSQGQVLAQLRFDNDAAGFEACSEKWKPAKGREALRNTRPVREEPDQTMDRALVVPNDQLGGPFSVSVSQGEEDLALLV